MRYLVDRPSPLKIRPEYKAKCGIASYLGSLFCREVLGTRYQVFMVRSVHAHAVVTRPFSMYERVWRRGYTLQVKGQGQTAEVQEVKINMLSEIMYCMFKNHQMRLIKWAYYQTMLQVCTGVV